MANHARTADSPLLPEFVTRTFTRTYPTDKENRLLVSRAQKGDVAARNRLILAHLVFTFSQARLFAKKIGLPHALFPDAFQEAVVTAHLKAIRRFRSGHNATWLTYLNLWIRAEIYSYAKHHAGDVFQSESRGPVKTHRNRYVSIYDPAKRDATATVGDMLTDGVDQESEVSNGSAEDRRARLLAKAMEALSPREREVLQLRYAEDLKRSEIGRRMRTPGRDAGISRERVRQIQVRAERKLRVQLSVHDEFK